MPKGMARGSCPLLYNSAKVCYTAKAGKEDPIPLFVRERSHHMEQERFVETYSQGVTNVRKIIVDTETGVNYLLLSSNMTSGCGVTVLVDRDGKPIVTRPETSGQ